MAILPLQNFTSLVSVSAAAVQGACSQLIDFTVGSVARALMEANATVALWLQWLVLQVLALTRASTSAGTDLDSWMADFSFVRLGATSATGQVTFTRYTTGSTALLLSGAQVKTLDTTQTFTVLPDPSNVTGFWNATAGGYQVTGAATSLVALVQAANPGMQGNVVAGAIGLLASAVPFDTVTNTAAFTNGLNAETDAAFRTRFALYINSRSLGTAGAIQAAVAGVQQGISSYLAPSAPYSGATTIYVDDGSGGTPSVTIAAINQAVQTVKAEGTSLFVLQAPVLGANIDVAFTSAAGYVHGTQAGAIASAVAALVGSLPVGAPLSFVQLASAVSMATPGIVSVPTLTVNGVQGDLVPQMPYQVIRLASLAVG